ncbi:MAG: hypothetical protein A2Z91_07370 [Deltaproteobacteria bacterium GWA2_38_16]|nr:MAG: hypothetical protein A2Z91_07370 [Deltaproteobacteria bacterium GWA2_38_16]OGQ02727.1 MAG: hypothetical protein A3D19_00705 [Deltaproteobacteria bacterium RIFCSPHIGHO2_02_FULL_38_15]OGQ59089.1 MAG: hypothetical protein A3G92_06200 [Deltaproteobacteria bacterium RIFCSPLOWO2_12_FULL_38_8]HBQ20587.1 hypothetical protein [Deltaproteobacteria bacterium]
MAKVRPFKAFFYNPQKIKTYENVFVPPYDVISNDEKKRFFKKSPYNFARIILGKTKKDGYKTVARRFREWQKKNILVQDFKECFYFVEQSFPHQGHKVHRYCIALTVSLADFKKRYVRPHEHTLEAPKSDRLKILKACQANLSPVFMMYEDSTRFLEKSILKGCHRPWIQARDHHGVVNKVWKIADDRLIAQIQKKLSNKIFYIVDGHHRFATALRYRELQGMSGTHDFVLTMLANMSDPALVINPIYRLLPKTSDFDKGNYLKTLESLFYIQKKKKISNLKPHQWGILFSKDPYFYELSLKDKKRILEKMKGSKEVKALDVAILQQVIIPGPYISSLEYIRGVGEPFQKALKLIRSGKSEVLWFVKEPTVQQLKKVSDVQEVMPPKSTYFYPKLLSGTLIRIL